MAEIAKIHGQDIRDKRIADATDASSASDITSQCKFLLENGQTGEFMQVLKSYIDESVRSALGPLLNNLDKGTGLKAVAGIDSNNDLGTATLSNLASMLSDMPVAVFLKMATQTLTDCNLPYLNRVSYVGSTASNRPSGATGSGWVLTLCNIATDGNALYRLQWFYSHSQDKLWFRGSSETSGNIVWKSWHTIF